MFFILSKTLNYLIMPQVITIILLLLSALLKNKRWKKWTFRGGLILLIFWSNEFIANETMKVWELPATPFAEINRTYEWGVVLSGVTMADVEPTDRVYFQRGADRVVHTVQLYKLGKIKKILVSGGSGRLIDSQEGEAISLASVMVMMGVKEEDIVIESDSRNTHESAVATKKILESVTTPDNCILITSAFHMRRSAGCFAKEGWKMDTFTTDFYSHKRVYSFDVLVVPKLEGLIVWHHLLKEWVGYVFYWVAGFI